jgi:NAD-dependent DNA ligase
MFLTYKNRFNEVKAYTVDVVAENDDYLDIFDKDAERVKTFKKSNLLSKESTFDEALNKAEILQKDYQIIERTRQSSRDNWNNLDGKFEVCFTGFPKAEKTELTQYANENGLFIRKSVTKDLGLLVCGKTAGWKKLETANKLNIPRVIGTEGFYNFLETGEFVE